MPVDMHSDQSSTGKQTGETQPTAPRNQSRRFKHARPYSPGEGRRRRNIEWFIENALMVVGLTAVVAVLLVLAFMLKDALPLFFRDGVSLWNFLTGDDWRPIQEPPKFEILALVVGSALITFGAAVIAIPVGVACAIYLAEVAPRWIRESLKPTIELLAAIPSVVMGFIGLMVLNPLLLNWMAPRYDANMNLLPREDWGLDSGLCALAGAIMLAFMSMPTIISIAEDALSAVPRNYREGSLALGASRLTTIRHVVVPAARSGLVAACMLGVGRALGETMTVLMVAGNAIEVPLAFLGDGSLSFVNKMAELLNSGFGFFESTKTMTATIAAEMGETAVGSPHYHALFAVGALLCLISFVITFISDYALRRKRK